MSTPLTDSINALTRYANETTGASDTTLSEAVETLVDGYGQGGSSSSWTKVAEKSYTVENFTKTSSTMIEMWATGHSEIWTDKKYVHVRIRDTAGKRAGYFYGSDQFFVVPTDNAITSSGIACRFTFKYTSSGTYGVAASYLATGYGVYADALYPDGRIRICQRYHSSNSLTVNGTYKVEVYLLDPAGGVPIFE